MGYNKTKLSATTKDAIYAEIQEQVQQGKIGIREANLKLIKVIKMLESTD